MAKFTIPVEKLPDPGKGAFMFRIVTDDRNSSSAWSVIIDIPSE